ncbi:SDR family NAD(P)-dependent oxidoreductase [Tautonia plasticadhaerens]|uniref:Levodione reductase n=1 Tax=Tautonia plasticadhaerens TaxID=2527974 RepID=A0A518HB32_9BACT|nr:SDR family oxidoreductase [Tautonia plasticadhaerens]QDV38073.1 Levodione reductase [Tautonia plasticadhaerens]
MAEPQTVLITGGTGGIGSALARILVERGDRVVLFARHEGPLRALASELGGDDRAIAVSGDAGHLADLERASSAAVERFGRLDGLAHCIGSVVIKPLHLLSPEEFDEAIRINLRSAFNAVKAVLGPMRAQNSGSVVLFSTVAVRQGINNHEGIAAAKAGIEGLVRSAAVSYARSSIRFNAVAPGMTETGMTEPLLKNDASRKFSASIHPLGRIGQPSEPAAVAAFLLGPGAGWITGQVWGVDGGLGAGIAPPRTATGD